MVGRLLATILKGCTRTFSYPLKGLRALAALGNHKHGYQDSSNSERGLECSGYRKVDLPTDLDASFVNGLGRASARPGLSACAAAAAFSASAPKPRLLSFDRCQT